jgi:diguanylate cyclase (GGDEF)-like protein/PAS domain S-box-containing protein
MFCKYPLRIWRKTPGASRMTAVLRRRARLSHRFSIFIFCISALSSLQSLAAEQEIDLHLKWYHQFQFAGYYAAEAQGYFRDEGLKVNLIEGGADKHPLRSMLQGEGRYAITDAEVVLDRLQGKPVVAIAAIFQHSPYIILSRSDRGIRTVSDLIGKKVMFEDGQGGVQFKAVLLREGLSIKDLQVLPHSWNLQDLIDGKVDAVSAYATAEPNQLLAKGIKPAVLQGKDYGVDFYGDTLVTSETEARRHPLRVEAMVRATRKGWEYALQHPDEVIDQILSLPGVKKRGITREILRKEHEAMRPYILSEVVEIGHMNPGRWAHIADVFVQLGTVPKDYDLEGFLYQPEVHREAKLLQATIVILMGIALIVGVIVLWNLQMRRSVKRQTAVLQEEVAQRQRAEQALQASEQMVRLTFDAAASGIAMSTLDGRTILANPAYCEIVGYTETELHDIDQIDFTHPEDVLKNTQLRNDLLAGRIENFVIQKRYIRKNRSMVWVKVSVSVLRREDGTPANLIHVVENIEQQKQLEAFKTIQNTILEYIAKGMSLSAILTSLVEMVEAQYPLSLCSILLLDKQQRLRTGAFSRLPEAYMQALDGVQIGSAVGSCGTAAFEKRRVIVSDIATDPLWKDYRGLAAEHGLRACWSVPILSSRQQVLGTFAVYSKTVYLPDAQELELLSSSSNLAGIAIERHASEEHLRLLENSIATLNDIVLITEAEPFDEPGPRIVFVNQAFERLTGYTREEVIGKTPRILQGENTQKSELERIRNALKRWEPVRSEVINYKKNGEEIWLDLNIVPLADANGWYTHWVAVERDITERKRSEQEIQHLAFYDPLTKLPNRQLLMDRLEQQLTSSGRTALCGALLFIDLDNFKILNDSHGHDLGDLLLKQVAQRIVDAVRASDTVARLGGDEFVVILENLSADEAEAATQSQNVAEKILHSFTEPFHLPGLEHHTTPSIGIASFGGQRVTVEELLKHADLAMYQAKAAGRNTFRFFNPEMQAMISARIALEEDLRQAIRNQELFLVYQPQVDQSGAVIGLEALLRWQHPTKGMIPPMHFIPLAEDTGLILPIGRMILDIACRQIRQWASVPYARHLEISVNVSARQFRQVDFAEQVFDALQTAGAEPGRLNLELTESLLVENVEDIIDKMMRLKEGGVGFSLDDFGTGYSSLSYLKRLPLEQLKIDQSFVRDILTDPNDAAIVRTIIALGQSLGLSVIAEGVENEAQRDFLYDNGCTSYQGYFFSKPMVIADVEEYLSARALQP